MMANLDLIDRAAASKMYEGIPMWGNVAQMMLDCIPAVDAVEVVRCKGCRFCKQNMLNKKFYCYNERWVHKFYSHLAPEVTEEHFCAYGKRRADKAAD